MHSPLLGQYCFQARLGAGLPGRGLAVNAFAKSNGVQLGVRRLLFVEIRGQEADDNIVAELLGPCDERTVATDFVVLDRMGVGDDRGVEDGFVCDLSRGFVGALRLSPVCRGLSNPLPAAE